MDDQTNITQGGITIGEGASITIGAGDVVGRDKIVNNIQNIIQRALTAAEEAGQDRALETQALAQGVSAFVSRLQAIASETNDAGASASPYKGLLSYRLSDSEIFFGRSQAIAGVLARLQRGGLTILHSESGSGKSSLVQAGLSPRLITAGHLPIYIRPYNANPALVLKRAFLSDLSQTPLLATAPLRDFLRQVSGVVGEQTTLYIILDQAEELFTQLDEPARAEFIGELAECLNDEGLNARWMLSLRTEFFGNLANFRPQIQNPFENDYRLNRLTRAEAQEVVTAPAARREVTFEAGVVNTLLDDLGKDNVPPPQIQLVCSALYEGLGSGEKVISRAQYDAAGGAPGILRDHLARVLGRDLKPDQRPVAQRVFESLITADGRRAIRTRAELIAELNAGPTRDVPPETLAAVLDQLVDSRLLLSQEQEVTGKPGSAYELAAGMSAEMAGNLAYELAHDYLLAQIQLDPAVQARKAAQELLEQETSAYQRFGTLLNDDKLAIIESKRDQLAFDDASQALLKKSEAALRRRRGFVLGGVGLVVVLIVVGVLSVISAIGAQSAARSAQAQQATSVAQAQAEVAAAQSLRATSIADAQLSVSAALTQQAASEAAAREAQAQKRGAERVIEDLFKRTALVKVGPSPASLLFAEGRLWAASFTSNVVESVDPDTGARAEPLPVGVGPSALIYDGARLWVANKSGHSVQTIEPKTGLVGPPIEVGGEPVALAFDGEQVWVANQKDNTVQTVSPVAAKLTIPVGNRPSALAFGWSQLWVANAGDNTVQAIDPITGVINRTIGVGAEPSALAFADRKLWVINKGDNTVQVIDPATGIVGDEVPVGAESTALLFDGTRLWVASAGDDVVSAIDPLTGSQTFIRVGSAPGALAYDGQRMWVANTGDATLQTFNATREILPLTRVGLGPAALAHDGNLLWIANYLEGTVESLALADAISQPPQDFNPESAGDDGASTPPGEEGPTPETAPGGDLPDETPPTDEPPADEPPADEPPAASSDEGPTPILVSSAGGLFAKVLIMPHSRLAMRSKELGSILAGPGDIPIEVGIQPSALIFDGKLLWVANRISNTVQSIDPQTGLTGEPITVGRSPSDLAFDGQHLWVANRADNTVQAIDLDTGEAALTVQVGLRPSALVFDGQRLWVANAGDNTIQAVDPKTGRTGPAVPVGNTPGALAFDGERLWVANLTDNTVQAVNPVTGVAAEPIKVGNNPTALLFDGALLWVANYGDNTVQAVNPKIGVAELPIRAGDGPAALAFDGERLWIADYRGDAVFAIVVKK